MTSGEGILTSFTAAQRRAMFVFALTLAIAGCRFATESWAAGVLAVGKCGAYGQAIAYVVGSVFLSIIALFAGLWLIRVLYA